METKNLKREIGLVKAEGAYKTVVMLSVFMILASLIITGMMYLKTEKTIKDISSKVVVLDANGTVSSGTVKEVNETELLKLQSQNVLRLGVDYLFSFSAANYDDRIKLGRAYFGRSGDEILQGYVNDQVRDKVMQNDLRVDVVVKTIQVDLSQNGLVGKVEFEQSFVNGSAVQKRTIKATCTFEKSQVSSKNAYGIVIDNWIIQN